MEKTLVKQQGDMKDSFFVLSESGSIVRIVDLHEKKTLAFFRTKRLREFRCENASIDELLEKGHLRDEIYLEEEDFQKAFKRIGSAYFKKIVEDYKENQVNEWNDDPEMVSGIVEDYHDMLTVIEFLEKEKYDEAEALSWEMDTFPRETLHWLLHSACIQFVD